MTHPNGRTTHLGERAAHPDERIAPKAPTGAEAPSVCASEIARDASRRTSSRRQRAVAGAVAVCAAALIATSACFLFVPADHNDIGSLFATTTEAASQRGQDDAENADAPDEGRNDDAAREEADAGSQTAFGAAPSSDGGTSSPSGAGTATSPDTGESADSVELPDGGASEPSPSQAATVTVSVTVSSSAVGGSVSGSARPTFPQGATAYDALCAVGLSVNAERTSYGIYVAAVGGLAQKEHGGKSGWMYSVNGVVPMTSCGNYILRDGDDVQWYYVM